MPSPSACGQSRAGAGVLESDKPWYDERRAGLEARIHDRLGDLSWHLSEADWLEGTFSAGDLMMISVLRRLRGTALLDAWPRLAAYVARGEACPAFQSAFEAQRALSDTSRSACPSMKQNPPRPAARKDPS